MAALNGQVFDFSLGNDTSVVGLLQKINSFTDVGSGGAFGIFILLVFGVTLFLMMKAYGSERSLTVTMFASTIVGLLLRLLGLIGDFVYYICISLFILGVIFLMKDSEKYEA